MDLVSNQRRVEEIKIKQPFKDLIKIIDIEPLLAKSARSGESFKITSEEGKTYKLRYCFTIKAAKKIEKNVNLFPKAFPKLYVREGKFLLFEWIDGKELAEGVTENDSYKIGKLLGELHELNIKVSSGEAYKELQQRFVIVENAKIFDAETFSKIKKTCEELKRKLKVDFLLEIYDTGPKNFVISKKGKVYFIDQGGMGHHIKGLGFSALLDKTFSKDKRLIASFWKGYNEHHSGDYFDRDYQRLVRLLTYIFLISVRVKENKPVESWLMKVIKKEIK